MKNYLKSAFELKLTNDTTLTKETLMDQKFILFVYPKDHTSACTLEAREFSKLYDAFKAEGYEVYGISKDTLGSHKKFKEKEEIPFELVADPQKEVLTMLDVFKEKKMFGKTVMGTVRSTFIFDEGLKLTAEFRDIKASGHAEAILEFVKDA
jgi:peroxiredoxin Q/BCP